jgi:hypothetical protein
MSLRSGEQPGPAIAVFPFLKTHEGIRVGSFTFRSTDDVSELDTADAAHVAEVAGMLFLQDDLRIRSASYAVLPPLDLDHLPWRLSAALKVAGEAQLKELEYVQTIIAYCYSAPHEIFGSPFFRFEHASLAIFSPEPVFIQLVRPEHHVEHLSHQPLVQDPFGRVEGYRGLYNFRQHFWVAKGSRCYPPVPHIGLNISQDLSSDLSRCFSEGPQHMFLPELLRQPTSATADRVLTALGWYNRANSLMNDDHAAIVHLATAFETLLGLPKEARKEQVNSAISLLLGRTPRLGDWEEQFSTARSEIVHQGRASRLQFVPPRSKSGANPPYRDLLADGRQIFQLCVGTVLFGTHVAERVGLADKMVSNQERFDQICKTLDSASLTPAEKLSGIADKVALACRYRFVGDPGLLNQTLIRAARRTARTLLSCGTALDALLKEPFEKLATAPDSGDWYEALDALRMLNELKIPLPQDHHSPQAIAQQLTSLVWQYTFSHYYWLREARSKQPQNSS